MKSKRFQARKARRRIMPAIAALVSASLFLYLFPAAAAVAKAVDAYVYLYSPSQIGTFSPMAADIFVAYDGQSEYGEGIDADEASITEADDAAGADAESTDVEATDAEANDAPWISSGLYAAPIEEAAAAAADDSAEANDELSIAAQNEDADTLDDTSLTYQNLYAAVQGETNATAAYRAFAAKATEEGYAVIARLFLATADAEAKHANDEWAVLSGMGAEARPEAAAPTVGTTAQNLQAAFDGETYEYTVMYPEFAAAAEAEGMADARRIFGYAQRAEQVHAGNYKDVLDNFDDIGYINTKYATVYRCLVCGEVVTERPSRCPICGASGDTFAMYDATYLIRYSSKIENAKMISASAFEEPGASLFKEALSSAIAVAAGGSVAQDDFGAAVEALDGAIGGLVPKSEVAAYSELLYLLLETAMLDGTQYTKASWGALMLAYASAWDFFDGRMQIVAGGAGLATLAAQAAQAAPHGESSIEAFATMDDELIGHIRVIRELLAALKYASGSGGDEPQPPVAGDYMKAGIEAAEPEYNLDVEYPTDPPGAKHILSAQEFKDVSYVHLRFSYEYKHFNCVYFLSDYLMDNGFEIDTGNISVADAKDSQGKDLRYVSLYLRHMDTGGIVEGGDVELLYIYLMPINIPTDMAASVSLNHIDISYGADGYPVDADVEIAPSVGVAWVCYYSAYDINRSGDTTLADVDFVRRNLGKDPAAAADILVRRCDVNHDGVIDVFDLMATIAAYEYNLP